MSVKFTRDKLPYINYDKFDYILMCVDIYCGWGGIMQEALVIQHLGLREFIKSQSYGDRSLLGTVKFYKLPMAKLTVVLLYCIDDIDMKTEVRKANEEAFWTCIERVSKMIPRKKKCISNLLGTGIHSGSLKDTQYFRTKLKRAFVVVDMTMCIYEDTTFEKFDEAMRRYVKLFDTRIELNHYLYISREPHISRFIYRLIANKLSNHHLMARVKKYKEEYKKLKGNGEKKVKFKF